MRAKFSIYCFVTRPAWYAVPHATMRILLKAATSSAVQFNSSKTAALPSSEMCVPNVSRTAFGWS